MTTMTKTKGLDAEKNRYGRLIPLRLSFSRDSNILTVDALTSTAVTSKIGYERRCLTRTNIEIPWSPSIFLAIREGDATNLRKDINLSLSLRGIVNFVTFRPYDRVNMLIREMDRTFWYINENSRLYEIRCHDQYTKRIVEAFLTDNASSRANEYCLFAVRRDVAFNVAIATALRLQSTENTRRNADDEDYCTSDDDEDEDENEEREENAENEETNEYKNEREIVRKKETKIDSKNSTFTLDLAYFFEFCEWCYYDTERGNFLTKMSSRDLELNGLSKNPIRDGKLLPVIVYDIETIASNENILPRGVEEDQRLSSFALSVHLRDAENDNFAGLILAYVPLEDSEYLKKKESEYRKKFLSSYTNIYFYRNELDLLIRVVDIMTNNEYLLDVFQTTDVESVKIIASILTGYNVWDYDFQFIVDRLIFYGEYDRAIALAAYRDEPRFNRAQISFDLIKHVIARHRAITGSVALSHVAKFFGAATKSEIGMTSRQRYEKMNFDAVSIRRLYFDTNTGIERFDGESAFETNGACDVNLEKIFRYNIQDCATVYYLMLNLNFIDIVVSYSKHFFTPLIDCSYVGNSRLLPNAIAVQALRIANTVIPYRDNKFVAVMLSSTTDEEKEEYENEEKEAANRRNVANAVRELRFAETSHFGKVDELEVMRIDESKMYVGGINSAESGHYPYTLNVDFASFYPSIGCTYGLSMETVKILTVEHLIFAFDGNERIVDRMMELGILRVFDYEPQSSKFLKLDDRRNVIRGKDDLARCILRRVRWYEGVEFSNVEEMRRTSRSIAERRVLMVKLPDLRYKPIVKTLWEYYLSKRKEMKMKLKSLRRDQIGEKNVLVCLEKMYKVISNCMYGDQNYIHSSTYSPPVAAAICLLSRKTFHETTWIVENEVSRWLNDNDIATDDAFTKSNSDDSIIHANYGGDDDDDDADVPDNLDVSRASRTMETTITPTPTTSSTTTTSSSDDPLDASGNFGHGKISKSSKIDPSSNSLRNTNSENPIVRIKTIYRDTDGAIFSSNVSIEDEEGVVRYVNARLNRSIEECRGVLNASTVTDTNVSPTIGAIFLELESVESPLCTIMGKKKYWRIEKDRSIVTKGFEKNAQSFVKELVATLQRNVLAFVETVVARKDEESFENLDRFRRREESRKKKPYRRPFFLQLTNPVEFYVEIFRSLDRFYAVHGEKDFTFNILLNPLEFDTPKARFVEETLALCDYDVGDRAKCLYRLDPVDPFATELCLIKNFDPNVDSINYYKSIRNLAAYFLQLVEGRKKSTEKNFDRLLREAYSIFLKSAKTLPNPVVRSRERPASPISLRRPYEWLLNDSRNDRAIDDDATCAYERSFIKGDISIHFVN